MKNIRETDQSSEIYIGMIGPVALRLLADLMWDSMDEDLDLIDRTVSATAAVGS